MTAKTNLPRARQTASRARKPLQTDRKPDGTTDANQFRKLLGYTTVVFREGEGAVEIALGPQHMNSLGIVHGGLYMTLLDAAMGHAVAWCRVPENVRSAVTVSLTATFLAVAQGDRLLARAKTVATTGRIVTLTGEVVDAEGTVCVTGQGSYMYLPGSERPDGVPRRKPGPG
jgi:uncharacterized protein (TIGR00369 family)